MLFAYRYVPHRMEKMQEFIDFIFFEVWCKAPGAGPFGLHLFDGNAELKEVMTAFHYSDSKGATFFNGHVERIYGLFAALSPPQILQLQRWYRGNNDLEHVCGNDPVAQLARYADIDAQFPALAEQLPAFFKGLYASSLLGLKALRDMIGDIDDHYQTFVKTNATGKCPFCGISDLFGEYHSKREAYDHYLPKAIYPFNSINFHNLVPACHHCNSSYKGSKHVAYTPKDPCGAQARRKMFYPFSTQPHRIELTVSLGHADAEHLRPHDVDLRFGPPDLTEQIETWKDVYGIEERYRAKLCSADAKAWIVEVLDEWRWHEEAVGAEGKAPQAFLRDVARHAAQSPYAHANFLKHGFLQACASAGVFDKVPGAKVA
jgi:hypothetical protein